MLTRHTGPPEGDDRGVSEIRKNAISRSVRLASIPWGVAGRTARGFGQRMTGRRTAEAVAADQEATAAEVFSVLGNLKGGAMKVGQLLSVMETALPEDVVAPYRQSLRQLQEAAPPMTTEQLHTQLAAELGPLWRDDFDAFDDEPVAAASLGQVHRATLDGATVAVKVQYPGAEEAFRSDLAAIGRLGKLAGGAMPAMDMAPLVAELKERAAEELDYTLEGQAQQACAEAFADSLVVQVPQVIEATQRVLVSEWLPGTPLADVIVSGSPADRDLVSRRYLEFLLLGPELAGILHADPHPGNFRVTADGRLGVMDFGAVKRLPDGMPGPIGRLLAVSLTGDAAAVEAGLREEGFIRAALPVDAENLLEYLSPFVAPIREAEFTFTREWLGALFQHVKDPSNPQWSMGLKLNLPPEYLLIYRVWSGALGMLCQIGGTVPVVEVFSELLPEFSD